MDHADYVNAPAHLCSFDVAESGQRIVRYRGNEYAMIGLYFIPDRNAQRMIVCILRPVDGHAHAGLSLGSSRWPGSSAP